LLFSWCGRLKAVKMVVVVALQSIGRNMMNMGSRQMFYMPQRCFSAPASPKTAAKAKAESPKKTPPAPPTPPAEPQKKKELLGSVNQIKRHIFVGAGKAEEWPRKAQDLNPLYGKLWSAFRESAELKENQVTLFEVKETGKEAKDQESMDVYVFPENLKVKLDNENYDNFVADVKDGNIGKRVGKGFLNGIYVFICSHSSHDTRCGTCGPPIYDEFVKQIAQSSLSEKVSIHKCSHIGGHVFAGNVVIFNKGIGDWYGYVKTTHVPMLINTLQKGEIYYDLWRGRMGKSKEEIEKMYKERF